MGGVLQGVEGRVGRGVDEVVNSLNYEGVVRG